MALLMHSPDTSSDGQLKVRSRPGRRPIQFAVVGDESRARALAFRLEVYGHEAMVVRSGREVLEIAPERVHAFLIDDSVPDVAPASLAEGLRLDSRHAETWIFNLSSFSRPHREVSEGSGTFDRILVTPVADGDLAELIRLAGHPRSRTGN